MTMNRNRGPGSTIKAVASFAAWAALAIGLAACGPAEPVDDAVVLPYATEYPAIAYAGTDPGGRLGEFARRVADGEAGIRFEPDRGYLESVLAALEIDTSSQVLVFSRTSLQTRQVRPSTPRAIYFNDDSYVAWVPGAPRLEMSSFDPELGPVFFTIDQVAGADQTMQRQLGTCLRCHDTYSLSGGGVPRFLLGSGYTGTDGELVSHEAWILTGQATPLSIRWGGWYVTGRHGDQVHLGNMVVERPEDLQELESLRRGNVDELGEYLDTSVYPTPYSDIVALMVLEHQVEVQNLVSRLRFESVGRSGATDDADAPADHVEALSRSMLMIDAAGLDAPISGGSGFAAHFEAQGPSDASGRSLRQLDLESRLFRYPLSYLIYAEAFQALPTAARAAVYSRLREVLAAEPEQDGLDSLSAADRAAILEILRDTLPEFFSL